MWIFVGTVAVAVVAIALKRRQDRKN